MRFVAATGGPNSLARTDSDGGTVAEQSANPGLPFSWNGQLEVVHLESDTRFRQSVVLLLYFRRDRGYREGVDSIYVGVELGSGARPS